MIHFLRYVLIGGLASAFSFGFVTTFGDWLNTTLWAVANAVNF